MASREEDASPGDKYGSWSSWSTVPQTIKDNFTPEKLAEKINSKLQAKGLENGEKAKAPEQMQERLSGLTDKLAEVLSNEDDGDDSTTKLRKAAGVLLGQIQDSTEVQDLQVGEHTVSGSLDELGFTSLTVARSAVAEGGRNWIELRVTLSGFNAKGSLTWDGTEASFDLQQEAQQAFIRVLFTSAEGALEIRPCANGDCQLGLGDGAEVKVGETNLVQDSDTLGAMAHAVVTRRLTAKLQAAGIDVK